MKRLLICFISICAVSVTVSAHVLDEYLQAAQIALAPDGVCMELRLIPGVELADRVFGLIDINRDGQTSSAEQQAYVQRVLQDIVLELDQHPLPLTLTTVEFPSRSELKKGDAAILLVLSAPATLATPADHQLTFRNNHLPKLGVYQANALVPTTNTISITRQQRDPQQHELQLHFRVVSVAQDKVVPTKEWMLWPLLLVTVLCLTLSFHFIR
jgi:hypothetical protein